MKKNHFVSRSQFRLATSVISLLLLFFCVNSLIAQSEKTDLERQKRALLQKISQNQVILDQTAEKKSSSLGRLNALNNQISSRSKLIGAINREVALLDERIAEDQEFIDALDADLEAMQQEYATMIYTTQKTSSGFDQLTFLFAASTFDQLFMRLKYIKQYAKTREKQRQQITLVQENLNEQIAEIEIQKGNKKALLNEELAESDKLQNLQSQQRRIVQDLEKEEKRLRAELRKQRKSEKELTNRIDAIIEAERRAALLNSADMSVITSAFTEVKGRLRWPVEEGFISSKYGKHKHPTLKRVTLNNKHIGIQTAKDANVKSVFNGKVVGVMSIQGQGITVLIQHGEYFTAYSKLKAVTVKKGDTIVEGQRIGQVITGNDNVSEMWFRIVDKSDTVNPEYWLQSKIN